MLCNILKQYRAEHGLSVPDLAAVLGVPEDLVQKYEAVETDAEAHYMPLSWDTVLRIQRLSGCGLLQLLCYPDLSEDAQQDTTK